MNTTGFITDLKAWIDNNLEEKLDINTVADRAGYSKWHLQRMFKRQTGYALGSISACKTESVGGARPTAASLSSAWRFRSASTHSSRSTAASNANLAKRRATGAARWRSRRPWGARTTERLGSGDKKPEFAFGLLS